MEILFISFHIWPQTSILEIFPYCPRAKKFWPFSCKPHCLKREGCTFQMGKNIVSYRCNIWKECSLKRVMTGLSTRKLQRKTTARNLKPPLTSPSGASFPWLCSLPAPWLSWAPLWAWSNSSTSRTGGPKLDTVPQIQVQTCQVTEMFASTWSSPERSVSFHWAETLLLFQSVAVRAICVFRTAPHCCPPHFTSLRLSSVNVFSLVCKIHLSLGWACVDCRPSTILCPCTQPLLEADYFHFVMHLPLTTTDRP